MRKFLLALLLVTFFLTPSVSLAQNSTPIKSPRGQEVRTETKARIQQQREVKQQALDEMRQARIRKFFERMLTRFEAAITRLEKLIGRIQARFDKIKTEDTTVDLTDEQAQLDEAGDLLEDAKDKILDLKSDFETLLTSDDPKTVFKAVGQNVRDLKQDLTEIHTLLVKVIGDIKGLRVGAGKTTPTPTP